MKNILLAAFLVASMVFLASCGKEPAKSSKPADSQQNASIESEDTTVVNPNTEITEDEAKKIYPDLFRVPKGAKNIQWTRIEAPGSVDLPIVELSFDLNGNSFSAREAATGKTAEYAHGMNYEWTAKEPFSFTDKSGETVSGEYYRYNGEEECADLCTWYDANAGMSYSLSVTADSLDGFDLQAIVEAIAP